MTYPNAPLNAAAAAISTAGLYVDFHIPLGLHSLLQQVALNTQGDPNSPQVSVPSADRTWFSQPRSGSDPTIEVVTINFKLPMSVSEIGWEALRTGCSTEIWYLDRLNNWRQLLDESRNPVALNLSTAAAPSWYTAHYYCYPVVAKAVQFRVTRVYDAAVGSSSYVVGIRNTLIRRNIYTNADGTMGIEPQQDALGNVITSYIENWDAYQAIDNSPNTFWRSAPQPDPQAVVSLYLDVRSPSGGPQLIDTVYLDPVHSGPILNLYYSNDDTAVNLKLSTVTALPVAGGDVNTKWVMGTGMWDISGSGAASLYEFPMAYGPLVKKDCWIGIEWAPDFAPGSAPSTNPVLFKVIPEFANEMQTVSLYGQPLTSSQAVLGGTFTLSYNGATTAALPVNVTPAAMTTALAGLTGIGAGNVAVSSTGQNLWTVTFQGALANSQSIALLTANTSGLTGGISPGITITPTNPGTGSQYWPTIVYDAGSGAVKLTLTNGTSTYSLECPQLSPLPAQYTTLRIVVGWSYSTNTVTVSIADAGGNILSTITDTSPPLSVMPVITLDGTVAFQNFRGLFTAHVVKLEDYALSAPIFRANPQMYVSPDPVYPNAAGVIASTTLDNAIYAAAWTVQENGMGGSHVGAYEGKTWTPIWGNYICQRGMLYFPQQTSMKYLKCEFTNLVEESYPVYDSGISTTYEVFPVSVTQNVTTPHPGLLQVGKTFLTAAADVILAGPGSVNFLNPSTVNNAVNSIFGQTISPIQVTTGVGYSTSTLPTQTSQLLANNTTPEVSSPWIFRRQPPNPAAIVGQLVNVITSASNSIEASALSALSGTAIATRNAANLLSNALGAL